MATMVLGAVGASLGGSLGGSILGLSGAVVGRAVGSIVGRAIDQAILGEGAEIVETGRLDRLRLTGASEGSAIPRVVGRVRVGGQVIWATRFKENRSQSGGSGKGGAPKPKQTSYSYSISMAIALCEGEITRVGRVWADGEEIARESIQMRVHAGRQNQSPDSLIEALEGAENSPSYRGVAYVVLEDLDLTPFGNRVPQFTFEVVRKADAEDEIDPPSHQISGVALIPGNGEYALATSQVHYDYGFGGKESANVNTIQNVSDFRVAMRDLTEELPNLKSVSLIVSWFGSDLRCGYCSIRPMVEQNAHDGQPMPWAVSGLTRTSAETVPSINGRPAYGGTPADASVIEAIRNLNSRRIAVTLYPFLLMDQLSGNGLPDPFGGSEQATLPWRGRITTSVSAGMPGSSDGTSTASGEVSNFFGFRPPSGNEATLDFGSSEQVSQLWSYRRFILHYAHLCAAAGGVEGFCIGSEMRGLTRIRGEENTFPAVSAFRDLARDVRAILPDAKLGYAADWSEYSNYRPEDDNNLYFHLDPLWADPCIDFIGLDNYMPLADWRDGEDNVDIQYRSVYDLDYLQSNVEGGEGFDWYYQSEADRDNQLRSTISDDAYSEPWVFRYKDIHSWWANEHFDRLNGIRSEFSTAWRPMSKPIRFIEYGCAAINKGANQPNKFLDPKSSESSVPYRSNGQRDDTMQQQYLRALLDYWNNPDNNPKDLYGRAMIDLDHSFAWAWDARPWPAFPQLADHWTDSVNYSRGHWLSGRTGNQPLASVIKEICKSAGLVDIDVTGVHGTVRGYVMNNVQTARADLQPLLLAYGVEATERAGRIVFSMRQHAVVTEVDPARLVRDDSPTIVLQRAPEPETFRRVVVHHVDLEDDFATTVADAVLPGTDDLPISEMELPLALTRAEGFSLAERFLSEAQIVRDTIDITLPPSSRGLLVGSQFRLSDSSDLWRIDRIEESGVRRVHAVRTEPSIYEPSDQAEDIPYKARPAAFLPVDVVLLELPLLVGDENEYAPHIAVAARPWPGSVAVYSAIDDSDYRLNSLVERPAIIGSTQSELLWARPGLLDQGPELIVRFGDVQLSDASNAAFLAGANSAAIGTGNIGGWEIFQFRAARPLGNGLWALGTRLRGQRGSEWRTPISWPVGSRVVILDDSVGHLDLGPASLGLDRHYRVGPASLPISSPVFRHIVAASTGEALKPYAPAHLRATIRDDGIDVEWKRRSRTAQSAWDVADAPLGEAFEAYRVQFRNAFGQLIAEADPQTTKWVFEPSVIAAIGPDLSGCEIIVAQISEVTGPGHAALLRL